MTDTNGDSVKSESQEPFILIPASLLQYARQKKLSGLQYELWLLLYELDPYGDRWVDIPSPTEIAAELNCDYRSVQRAALRLEDCHLFNFEIKRWKARNQQGCSRSKIFLSANGSKSGQLDPKAGNWINGSKSGQFDPNDEAPKARQRKGSRKAVENGNVPNKEQTIQTKQTIGTSTPAHRPVSPDIDREEFGTAAEAQQGEEISDLLDQAKEIGVRLNKTIRVRIEQLREQLGDDAAAVRIRNALSATKERQKTGTVRNPGGFFHAALKDGYTANQAKSEAKEKRCRREPPDRHQVEFAIDKALLNGDRDFPQGKLQGLTDMGHGKWVSELCQFRADWGFFVRDGKVLEVQA